MKLTVLFDGDAGQQAYDSLNTLRDLQRKMDDERRRNGDHTEKFRMLDAEYIQASDDFATLVLAAAVIWHDDTQHHD
jgi:hypothetical protein